MWRKYIMNFEVLKQFIIDVEQVLCIYSMQKSNEWIILLLGNICPYFINNYIILFDLIITNT